MVLGPRVTLNISCWSPHPHPWPTFPRWSLAGSLQSISTSLCGTGRHSASVIYTSTQVLWSPREQPLSEELQTQELVTWGRCEWGVTTVAASLSVHCTSRTVVKGCGHLVTERWCKSHTGNKQRGLSEKVNIKPWLRHTQHTSEP